MKTIVSLAQPRVDLCVLLFLLSTILANSSFAQTTGLIFKPATGAGKTVLDPNGDGYTSATKLGFTSNDRTESEIAYVPIVVPMLEPNSDLGPGPDCGYTDFVDSGSEDPALIYYDGTNFLVRFRLGKALPNSKGYSLLIDTDQRFGSSGPNADPDYKSTNPGFEVEINLQTNFGVYVYDVNNGCPGSPSASFAGDTNYQKSIAFTTNCGDPDYFYDFFVPFSALTALGVTSTTGLRMAIITQMNPQPAICNNALSDFGGIDDAACGSNFASCYGTIIDNYPPTSITAINTRGLDRSACPVITSPIAAGATTVSGTSSESSATITVFKNGTQIGTASVSSGAWSLTGIAPSLTSGDILTATATGIGKSESIVNCNPVTVAATCTAAITSVTACNAGKAFSGTGTPGAVIKVYYGTNSSPISASSGNVFVSGSVTVDGSGNWLWRCLSGGQTTSCTAGGGPCLADGSYRITQTLPGQCESPPTFICIGGSTATATPSITTSPVLTSTTSISGTSASGASIILYANGVQLATGIASGTSWTISGLSLTFGQVITAKAIAGTLCVSAASTGSTVTRTTVAPVVTGTYCTSTSITSVTGTSNEAAGTVIQVFKNGVANGSTTTVAANGNWTAGSGISFSPGDVISAKATITGGIQSAFSNTITVGNKTTTTATITTSPVIEATTSISGTGTNGNVIRLYLDDVQIGSTAVVAGGTWTISGLSSTDITAGSVLTVTATSGTNCESTPSAGVTVQCIAPSSGLNVTPDNASVCSGSIVVNVTIASSQSLVIYQLFNGASASGAAVLGNGGNIILNSGALSANTTLTVKASKISGVTCQTTLADNIPVTVNAIPSSMLTVVAAASTVCTGTGTNIQVQLSEPGFNYQLRNNTGNTAIGSPVAGTGGTINLPTGSLGSNTTFNVLVTGGSPTNCSVVLSTTPAVSIAPAPTISDAGPDQNICSSVGTTSMAANTPTSGTGSWSQISGPSTASINSPASATSSISGLTSSGTYRFQWSISSSPCTASTDLVDIIVKDAPTASAAGPDQNVCVGSAVTLASNNPVVGNGAWSVVSGPSLNSLQFSNVASNTSSFTPASAGTYILRWTISNSPCTTSKSDVTIVATDEPTTPSTASVTQPTCAVQSGTIVVNTQSDVEYGLNGIYQASNTFTDLAPGTYTLSVRSALNHNCAASAAGTVTINTLPTCTNAPPVANDDAPSSINEDSPGTSFSVTSNDTDSDGTIDVATVDLDPLTSGTQNTFSNASGDWSVNALGSVTYVPATNYNGTASIDYRVKDNVGASSNTATIMVTVNAVNDVPVVANNTESVTMSPFSGNVFVAGDNDPDGTALAVNTTPVSGPSHGSILINTDGTYTYTPTPGYTGADIVNVKICDNGLPLPALCSTKTITFNVNVPNSPPVANNDSPPSIDEDDAGTTFNVTSNDTDSDGTIDVGTVDLDPSTSGIQNSFANTSGNWSVNSTGSITYIPSADFNGTASINYRVSDNLGVTSNIATVSVIVNAVNDPPVLTNTVEAVTSSPFSSNVLVSSDNDPDGTTFTVDSTPVGGPSHGSIVVNTDGTYTYTPTPGYNGADLVTIRICDNGLPLPASCKTKTVTFNVNVLNASPIANNDTPSAINEDSAGSSFNVTSNDTDSDGTIDVATVDLDLSTTGIQNNFSDATGDWSVNSSGMVTYVPALNFNGTASIDYRVDDNLGASSNPATISVLVNAINDPPVLSNNNELVSSSPFAENIFTPTDNDPDGTPLIVNTTPVSGPSHGAILVNSDGTYTYTPTPGFTGSDIVTIQVCDSGFPLPPSCITKTITFNVNVPNASPVANDDSPLPITEDSPGTTFSVTSNDTDSDGTIDVATVDLDQMTPGIQNIFQDASGDWSVNTSGRVTYIPAINFNGSASINYSVKDNLGAVSNTATISITVEPVNDAPVLSNNIETVNNSPFSSSVLSIGDHDPDGTALAVTTTPVSTPSHGTILVNTDGTYTYTPTAGYTGQDNVTIEVCDNGIPLPSLCATKTITFNVNVTNSSPVANNDSPSSINEDSAGTIFNVTTNDTDPDGTIDVATVDLDPLSSGIQNSLTNAVGDWSVDASGNITYVPAANFNGLAAIDYRVSDNLGAASNIATVSLTVNPVNDTPVLVNNVETVNNSPFSSDVLALADNDPDGTSLTVTTTPVVGPSHGSILVNADGTYTYSPTPGYVGSDLVTIQVCDNGLPLPASCSTKTITFNVNVTNASPVANNDLPAAVNEDSPGTTFNVTSNDTDADGTIDVTTVDLDPSTTGVQNSFSAASGDWSVNTSGNVTFVPRPNFNGTASINYRVEDDLGAVSNIAAITLTVNAVNDAPVLSNNIESVASSSFAGSVLVASDNDPDGTLLTVNNIPLAGPSHGSIIININGTYTYTATPGYTGTDIVSVQVCDNGFPLPVSCGTKTITFNINVANAAPVANGATVSLEENSAVGTSVATVAATDADAGDILSFSIESGNTGNAFAIDPVTGAITVLTPSVIDFETMAVFVLTIKVTDNRGASSPATIIIQLKDRDDEDTDHDGIPDSIEKGSKPNEPVDTDKDGIPDFEDKDSDNDNVPDQEEAGKDPAHPTDTDSDGTPDYRDTDDDGDGLPTLDEDVNGNGNPTDDDTDHDGVPDYKDDDDDNDGIATIDEDTNHNAEYVDDDCDGDLVPDYRDKDVCKLKPELGFSPNGDGNSDVWQIHHIEDYPDNKVTIINRWGNEVYSVDGYDNQQRAWGGQSTGLLTLGDLKVPDGTYFYFIDLGDGSTPVTGYLVLKR